VLTPQLYTAPLLAIMIPLNFYIARNVNSEIVDIESGMHGMYIAWGCFIAATAASVCPSNDHSVLDLPGIIIWAIASGTGVLILGGVLFRAKFKRFKRNMTQARRLVNRN